MHSGDEICLLSAWKANLYLSCDMMKSFLFEYVSCFMSCTRQVGNTSILVYYRSIDLKETDLST